MWLAAAAPMLLMWRPGNVPPPTPETLTPLRLGLNGAAPTPGAVRTPGDAPAGGGHPV